MLLGTTALSTFGASSKAAYYFIISLLLKNFLTALYIQINTILSYLKYLLLAAISDIVLCLHIHGLVQHRK